MPFRVLMVLDHAYPPDIRVENEARSLVEAGIEVGLLALAPDRRPPEDLVDGVRVFRRRVPGRLRNWLRGLSGTLSVPGKLLAREIRSLHQRWPFDALHLHDLYLFGGGLEAGRALGVPVIGDLHENWVEALQHYAWSTSFPGNLAVSIPKWERLEQEWVTAVDHLVVVVEEAAERNRELGVPADRLVVVPNTVQRASFDAFSIDAELVNRVRRGAGFTVVYTGGMDIHRGLDNAIRAMAQVAETRPDAQLVLVGDGRVRPDLESLAAKLRAPVQFEGWQPQESIRSYIEAADVCLVPHRRTPHTDATLPHKLFHYMYAARPVVVTDCRPLDRIVTAEACGLVTPDGDTRALADAILAMGSDASVAAAMGARGRRAVEERWNWEAGVQGLLALYQRLAATR
ncbi:MAG: glycosyltransferase family 4 protein [Rhodothermales bacterium]|nr:glycosyltransferase family 4 protein [Rhodothermales bacterium]MBO6779604.1 glycosyltransferase family 4 protein [Rhodothermales bacterium]